MRRLIPALLACATLGSAAAPVEAGPPDAWHNFWYTVKRDYHRNNCWPDPFIYPDRTASQSPFAIQVRNGWKLQNLMGDHHFDANSQQLTLAGREKVRYILTQSPEQFRTVFVQRGTSADQTATRVDSIQKLAAQLLAKGDLPAIEETDMMPRGWPADEINETFVKYRTSAKPPQLPEPQSESK